MESNKTFMKMDERNKLIAYKVIAIMYILTIQALTFVIIYRQFVLEQTIHDFEDFAVILTVNSLFLITALLYFGAVPFQKVKIKTILIGYALIIVLGSLFTYAKYNIFQSPGLSIPELLDKLVIIFTISGLIILFWVIFAVLGKKKLEKDLDDD